MIRLDNYGYCLEEYAYDLQDGKVKEISYTLHNEKGQDCAVVGVYRLNGKPTRSVVLWPQTNPKGNDDTFANEEIPEMRLYLDCVNQKFNFDDIQIFSYSNSKDKDDNGFTTVFNSIEVGKQDINIYTGRDNILVYNRASNMIKTYKSTENGEIDYNSHIESIRLTNFGAITEVLGENVITAIANGHSKSYTYEKVDSPIESLQLLAIKVVLDDIDAYHITYDKDHMVQLVQKISAPNDKQEIMVNNIFSRSETEEFILKDGGKIGQVTDSIYPTLITDSYQNYKYSFLKLWTHDKMRKNEKDEIVFFQRRIYVLGDHCYGNLLSEIRNDITKLCINR